VLSPSDLPDKSNFFLIGQSKRIVKVLELPWGPMPELDVIYFTY